MLPTEPIIYFCFHLTILNRAKYNSFINVKLNSGIYPELKAAYIIHPELVMRLKGVAKDSRITFSLIIEIEKLPVNPISMFPRKN
jgi:hypothetical protein